MRRTTIAALTALLLAVTAAAEGIPVGFEVKGGIGVGYYSMGSLNDHLEGLRQTINANSEELESGFNVFAEGRVWFYQRVAGLGGYEHYWSEANLVASSAIVSYSAPADVLYLGGVCNIFSFPNFIDVNAGARGTFARVVYGTDEDSEGRLEEYKANDYGWDVFAEVNTNFLRPLEVGLTLGYRNLSIEGFKNKFEEEPVFSTSGDPVAIEYSGLFLYFTAGIVIW